jgi:hypothetical protein
LVEAALADVTAAFPADAARTPPRLEIADISPTTWDGVIVLWSAVLDEWLVRDRVMRAVMARLKDVGVSPGAPVLPPAPPPARLAAAPRR